MSVCGKLTSFVQSSKYQNCKQFLLIILCFHFILSFFLFKGFDGTPSVEFKSSKKNGGKLLVINGIRFFRNRQRNRKQYWKCSYYYKSKCPTIAIINEDTRDIKMIHEHRHSDDNQDSKLKFSSPTK